jgi:4-diphosphocytidyl-2-C-methyl-D-erythritol kinase
VVKQAQILAPAKINAHLSIGLKREDGFHGLLSLFHMIDLCDAITITLRPSNSFSVNVDMGVFEPFASNTMARAAHVYAKHIGMKSAVSISCEKHIPMEAGLGGGSSDAAAVLVLLNELSDYRLNSDQLSEIGAQVGSDVPFFLGDSAAACVEGRGEYLTPMKARDDLYGLIVMPKDLGISTAYAFGELDTARAAGLAVPLSPSKEDLIAMFSGPVQQWKFFNDFRAVVGNLSPVYDQLDELVGANEELFGTVSGSGAAYCILGQHRETVEKFRTELEQSIDNVTIYVIKSLHRIHSGVTVSL